MKKCFALIMVVLVLASLTACRKVEENQVIPGEKIDKSEKIIPLRDKEEEARNKIETALPKYFDISYNGKIEETVINEIEVYSTEETAQIELIRDLGMNEVAFRVDYDVKPVSGEELIAYTAGTGEESGDWVRNKSNVGILSPNASGDYEITSFGTGF